ncbi:MAG: hypothetical protein ACRDL5_07125, partial [Solirubrobacteraceae bacterium]
MQLQVDPGPQRGAHRRRAGLGPVRAAPVLLNRRAAARPTITGVERYAGEVIARLVALAPERYATVQPPRAMRRTTAGGHAWE